MHYRRACTSIYVFLEGGKDSKKATEIGEVCHSINFPKAAPAGKAHKSFSCVL